MKFFTKDQDTLIEQSICNYESFYTKILCMKYRWKSSLKITFILWICKMYVSLGQYEWLQT